jgi:hypothetical protein
MIYLQFCIYNTCIRPPLVQARYSRLGPIKSSSGWNASSITWTVIRLTTAKLKPHVGCRLLQCWDMCIFMILNDLGLLPACTSGTSGVEVEAEVQLDFHLKPMRRFLFSVWQLRVSWCRAPSLTRGWVCNLHVQLLLGLARSVTLGSKSRRTRDYILRDSPNLECQVPVFISPRKTMAQLYFRALDSFSVNSYDSQGYGWDILTCLHTGYLWSQCQSPIVPSPLTCPRHIPHTKHCFQQFLYFRLSAMFSNNTCIAVFYEVVFSEWLFYSGSIFQLTGLAPQCKR